MHNASVRKIAQLLKVNVLHVCGIQDWSREVHGGTKEMWSLYTGALLW